MTPEKLAKIRALANDIRGDPATRAIAQAALKRYAQEQPKAEPEPPPWHDPRHPGMRTDPDYDRYRFMDLSSWRQTSNGNPTYVIVVKGRQYRIVLFKHKKTPTYGWMRIDTLTDETEFSGKFATQAQAHQAAWNSLMNL